MHARAGCCATPAEPAGEPNAHRARHPLRSVVLVAALAAGACQAPPQADSAAVRASTDTSDLFEALKESPAVLQAFLRAMPKGGDLHSHLSGAIYAENYVQWAVEDGLCVDRERFALLTCPPPDVPEGGSGAVAPVADAIRDRAFYGRLIDALSTRNYRIYGRSGHDQFFATFAAFGPAARDRSGHMLAEAMRRAGVQNILYLELMASPGMGAAAGLAADLPWDDDLARLRAQLPDAALDAIVQAVATGLDEMEREARALLACHTDSPDPGCEVTVRLLAQALRTQPAPQVFAQLVFGFRLAQADDRVVGINLVAPEDDPVALRDYTRHMRAVAFASREAPDAGIALHAGELTLGLVPPEALRFHIREAVTIAGAQRIGHGTDALYEDDPRGLLDLLAARDVLVEINLTSNDVILGVAGHDHPFPVYRAAGVATALSTDDEGVSRIDLSHEYLRAVLTYDLSWADLRELSRNSLRYAFLESSAKAALLEELDRRFPAFEREAGLLQDLLPSSSGASRRVSK